MWLWGGPRPGSQPPPICVVALQAVLLWSPRRAPAQPAGHDPCQTLHSYPRPPRLCKLGDPGWPGGELSYPAVWVMAGTALVLEGRPQWEWAGPGLSNLLA